MFPSENMDFSCLNFNIFKIEEGGHLISLK